MFIDLGTTSLIIPGCCEASNKSMKVYLAFAKRKDDGQVLDYDKEIPIWTVPNHDVHRFSDLCDVGGGTAEYYYKHCQVSLTFCPYCGKKLPEIVKVKRKGIKVYTDKDGGYYCGTCKKRNCACSCYPPIVGYDAKPQ